MNPTKIPAQFLETSAASQDPEELGIISQLTEDAAKLEESIEVTEKLLDELKQRHKQVTEVEIPDRMTALGLTEITTTGGHRLTIKPFYQASIKREFEKGPHVAGAFDWLETNGHGGVVKTAIEILFPRGQLDSAKKTLDALKVTFGERVTLDRSVHAQTLKALTKEIMQAGKALPEEYFNVYAGRVAVIKKA